MRDTSQVRYLDRATPPHITTLILLSALSPLAMNIFLPSLPKMAEYFATDYRVMQLSVALYLAMNGLMQVLIGPLGDFFGRRPVILGSIGVFLVATLGCIFAPNVAVFLTFRIVQAAIVAGMALSRAVIRDMVGAAESAARISYVTMGMAVAPMVAPALGGFLDGRFGWQSSFWLLLALGALIFWLTWRDLGETMARREGHSLAQQIREYPELLISPRFWGYSLSTAFASGAFFAYVGGAPFVGTQIFGLSPEALGAFFGAPALGYIVGNGVSGRFTRRAGLGRMLTLGALISTSSVALSLGIVYLGAATVWSFFGLMTVVGLGNGMLLPNAMAGMVSVRPKLAGSASGLGGAIMLGGGAALSALAGGLLTAETGTEVLLWMMLISSVLGVITVIYTVRREARLAGT